MRLKYAVINGAMSLAVFIINGILSFVIRKVMFVVLDSDVVGLLVIFTEVLALLNLADMGISGSLGANLYDPINKQDFPRIKGILLLLKRMYKVCGFFFIGGCAVVSMILCLSFHNNKISGVTTALYFLLTALNIGLSYFFSYRLVILSVDQRLFRLKLINSAFKVLSASLQIFILIRLRQPIPYLLTEAAFTAVYFAVINLLIKKYCAEIEAANPILKPDDKKSVAKNTGGFACHQIGSFAVYGTNSLYTAVFAGLTSAAIFNTYQMIVSVMSGVIYSVYIGLTASIGSLVAAENTEKRYSVFQTIFFINAFLSVTCAVAFINCVQPFISVFFGNEYLESKAFVYLLALNFFVNAIRPSTEQFKTASGIFYQDRFVPLAEAALNTAGCITLGLRYGIEGIVAGNILSTVLIISWQKPYMVFKYVFKMKLRCYFAELSQYILAGVASFAAAWAACAAFHPSGQLDAFFINGTISILICTSVFLLFFLRTQRFKAVMYGVRQIFERGM